MEIGIANAEAIVDLGMGVEVAANDIREDKKEFKVEASSTGGDVHDLEGTLYDIAHYMSKVPLDRITKFETTQRQLEAGQLMASGERAGLVDRIRRLRRENLRVQTLLCIERDRVDGLLHYMALSQE
ncbi:hypothetical protein Tco_0354186, partial [Tanacetum coccineum]